MSSALRGLHRTLPLQHELVQVRVVGLQIKVYTNMQQQSVALRNKSDAATAAATTTKPATAAAAVYEFASCCLKCGTQTSKHTRYQQTYTTQST